jgi:glycosyltransferase involved in cell wall biosynthesis
MHKPIYSVIIPAYNEEDYLPETLSALSEAMEQVGHEGEVIVVDNNSSDRTPEIAEEFGATVVFERVNQISRARNAGARAAKNPYLIFLDADTLISAPLLHQAIVNMAEENCCGGGGLLSFDNNKPSFMKRKVIELLNWLARKLNFVPGCFMFCTKQAFVEVGGFNEKIYASEEIWFVRRLKKWGKENALRFQIITDNLVVSSSRKFEHPVRLFLSMILYFLFPLAIYFKSLCGFWYKRLPKN